MPRGSDGGATAKAASDARQYVFDCGEVLGSETGLERVLTPAEHSDAASEAGAVALAADEAARAPAALPAASAQQQHQQQQQQPQLDAAPSQPAPTTGAAEPGVDNASEPLSEALTASETVTPVGSASVAPAPSAAPTTGASDPAAAAPTAAPTVHDNPAYQVDKPVASAGTAQASETRGVGSQASMLCETGMQTAAAVQDAHTDVRRTFVNSTDGGTSDLVGTVAIAACRNAKNLSVPVSSLVSEQVSLQTDLTDEALRPQSVNQLSPCARRVFGHGSHGACCADGPAATVQCPCLISAEAHAVSVRMAAQSLGA